MADDEQVSGRREGFVKNCSPCSDKGMDTRAVKYCFLCETFFCKNCTEQHCAFLSKHRVTEIESDEVSVALTLQTEPCPQHGKAINCYCKEHDSITCDVCISSEHGSCKDVVYLPTFAHTVLKDIDESGVKSKLRRTIEQLVSIRIKQQDTLTSFQADREKSLKEIDDHHAELLDLLNKIFQSSKEQIKQTFERFSSKLQRHHRETEKCLAYLESSEKRLARNQGNDFPLFVELKKCQNHMKATEEVSSGSLENLKVRGFSVAVDDRLHVLLSELESLASVISHAPIEIKKKFQVDISDKIKKETCRIYGSCVLNDGSILIVDYTNKMLKCLDQYSLKLKDKLLTEGFPGDVCVINNSEVAVTQKKTVVIVSARPCLTPTRTISMNHFCSYVAYSQGELFISDDKKVLYIYNMEGSLLRKVSTDPSGQDIFSRTRHVMINASADKVYIADVDKGLIILGRDGQVQDKPVSDTIRGTWDVCPDGMGGLFVCGFGSNNVAHVSADGQITTEVLTNADGLVKPVSLCYDRLRKRLIVTQFDSDQLHVCELG